MKVLVLNCGSSSVKYQLIETSLEAIEKNADRTLARGSVERIGTASGQSRLNDEYWTRQKANQRAVDDAQKALDAARATK